MTTRTRRQFCLLSTAAVVGARFTFAQAAPPVAHTDAFALVAGVDRERIQRLGGYWLNEPVQTIASSPMPQSGGAVHDVSGAGQSQDHRRALVRLSQAVSALAAGYRLTRQEQYAQAATRHLLAWFVTPATKMNPNLGFAQGVHSGSTGISAGVMESLQLVEVARSIAVLRDTLMPMQWTPLLAWFHYYLGWLKTSAAGREARDTADVRGWSWALQAAEFARLLTDEETRSEVRDRFLTVQLPGQMAANGSFPAALASGRSYSDSVLSFELTSALAWTLGSADAKGISFGAPAGAVAMEAAADPGALVRYRLASGQSVCKAGAFLEPYLAEKAAWPYPQDSKQGLNETPRPAGLLFCGLACAEPDSIALWERLEPGTSETEFLRQPLLWV